MKKYIEKYMKIKKLFDKILMLIKQKFFKLKPNRLCSSIKAILNKKIVFVWWSESQNWGDAFSPWLIRQLTNKEPINASNVINLINKPIYSMTGSILQSVQGKKIIIWGSGFIHKNATLTGVDSLEIRAVRGPLTRKILLNQGIDCPEVYGDPALLMPKIYQPKVKKLYKLGIIPHYIDQKINFIKNFQSFPEIKIIDITSGIIKVVKEVNMCEYIASSTLHGIILADAYKIPSLWIKLSDNIIGNGFKFQDYFLSVGRKKTKPFKVYRNTSLEEIYSHFKIHNLKINLEKLIESCPFRLKNF